MNSSSLRKKIVKFFKDNPQDNYITLMLRKSFTIEELKSFLLLPQYKDLRAFLMTHLKDPRGLFTLEEINNKILLYPFLTSSDLVRLSEINPYEICEIINYIQEDEILEQVFEKANKLQDKYLIFHFFSSDKMRLKHYRKLSKEDQETAALCFYEDENKEKFINLFPKKRVEIISSLQNNDLKIKYYNKYKKILLLEEKAKILATIHDMPKLLKLIENESFSLIKKVIEYINLQDYDLLSYYLNQIKDDNFLYNILLKTSQTIRIKYWQYLPTEYQLKLIENCSNITDIERLDLLLLLNMPNKLINGLKLINKYPQYDEKYYSLISKISNYYHLNENHFLYLIKNFSFTIIRFIENKNIQNLINMSDDEFNKFVNIFNLKQIKMDKLTICSTLEAILQRKYRIYERDDLATFSKVNSLLDNNEFEKVKLVLLSISSDLMPILPKLNLSMASLINILFSQSSQSRYIWHQITNMYIDQKRAKYLKKNLELEYNKIVKKVYLKKDVLKYMCENYPVDLVLSYFPSENLAKNYSNLEIEFLKNRDLICQIILYKKDPSQYKKIPDVVKNNLTLFNNIFKKATDNFDEKNFEGNFFKQDVIPTNINEEFIIDILRNLDIAKISETWLNNPILYNQLQQLLKKYQILGWHNNFDELLSLSGLKLNAEVIASLFTYFKEIVTIAESNNKIKLTKLLDLAICFVSDSNKYIQLLEMDNFNMLASNPSPNSSGLIKDEIIKRALELIPIIRKRKFVSIPPFDENIILEGGKIINVVVGNFSNMINLTYGERTGSCMRIDEPGCSLFDFCLNNINGFHIRFTNPQTNNFVSRVSGFRNGNTVFLNELRYSKDSYFSNANLVTAIKKVARKIINLSQESQYPINNVVISPFYAMEDCNIPCQDLNDEDVTKGLNQDCYTDIRHKAIVLASSLPKDKLVPIVHQQGNMPKYQVIRDKIRILDGRDALNKVYHLRLLDEFLKGKTIDELKINEDFSNVIVVICGEDWYVALDKNNNICSFIMTSTNNKNLALKEAKEAIVYLKNNAKRLKQNQIAFEQGIKL